MKDKRRNTEVMASLAATQEISVDAAVEICCNSGFSLVEEQRAALKVLISGRHCCVLLLTRSDKTFKTQRRGEP